MRAVHTTRVRDDLGIKVCGVEDIHDARERSGFGELGARNTTKWKGLWRKGGEDGSRGRLKELQTSTKKKNQVESLVKLRRRGSLVVDEARG